MNERPPIPQILSVEQTLCVAGALGHVKDVFTGRYPACRTMPNVELRISGLHWQISHHDNQQHCELGHGTTPEEAFADLDRKLGPPMTPLEHLHWRCERLMQDAVALQAQDVVDQLTAFKADSTTLPVSSPAC